MLFWTNAQETSFQALKITLTTTPVLALPNLQKPFVIETDASDKGVGAILQQDGHLIAYFSKALGPKNQALSTYEKECLAILLVVDHWRAYLQHGEFTLKIDQKSLAHLDEQRLTTTWQHKALTKLLGLKYKICYKQGSEAIIFKLHGLPEAIISDRDRIFTSSLWQELFKLTHTELRMSTSYHPQIDGQTERVNQCLEAYLRCFVHNCPTKWKQWLTLAEFWYNTSYHTSLNSTPFKVLYGQKPRHLGLDVLESCAIPDLQEWLKDRKLMVQLLQQQLVRAQQRQKHQANKHRSERSFAVGDLVYLKLQPYIQTSIATRASHKLSFRYFGPFTILAKVGSVAYKLLLPETSSIHPIFHVSQLKKAIPFTMQVSSEPPDSFTADAFRFPIKVLQRRLKSHDDRLLPEVLIQWSSWPTSLATWELEDELKHQFLAALAWGQSRFSRKGECQEPDGRHL
jgi:hypothetical protein